MMQKLTAFLDHHDLPQTIFGSYSQNNIAKPTEDIRPTMDDFLYRYHTGWYPCFMGEGAVGPIGWRKYSHRGIQWLNEIHIGKKQFRDIFNSQFEFRVNTDAQRFAEPSGELVYPLAMTAGEVLHAVNRSYT